MFFKMNIAKELYAQMEEKIISIKNQSFDFYAQSNPFYQMENVNKEFSRIFSQVYRSEFDSSQIEKNNDFRERKEFTVVRQDMYGMCLLYCTFLSAIGIACVLMYKENYVFIGVLLTPPKSRNNTIVSDSQRLLRMGENSFVNTGDRSILFEDIYGILYNTEEAYIQHDSDWFSDVQEAICFYTMPEINRLTIQQPDFYFGVRLTGLNRDYYRQFSEENKAIDVMTDFNNVIFFREKMSKTDCFILGTLNQETGNNIVAVETEEEDTQYILSCSLTADNLFKGRRTLIITNDSGVQKIAKKFRNSEFGGYVQFVSGGIDGADSIEKIPVSFSESDFDKKNNNQKELQQKLAVISEKLLQYEYPEREYDVPLSELLERCAKIGRPLTANPMFNGVHFLEIADLQYVYRYEAILDKFAEENFDYIIQNPSKSNIEFLKSEIESEQQLYCCVLQYRQKVEEEIKKAENLQELADSTENYSYIAYRLCKEKINNQRNHFDEFSLADEPYRDFYKQYREFLAKKVGLQKQMEEFGAEKLAEILNTTCQKRKQNEVDEEETDILLETDLDTIREYAKIILERSNNGLKVNSKVQNAEDYFSRLYVKLRSENQPEESISPLDKFFKKLFKKEHIYRDDLEELAGITEKFFSVQQRGNTKISVAGKGFVSIEELYEFFKENVYGNTIEVQLQSIAEYKKLNQQYTFLTEVIRRSADKNEGLTDVLFEDMKMMVQTADKLTDKMNSIIRTLQSTLFSSEDTMYRKKEVHDYLARIYHLVSRYAEDYLLYRESVMRETIPQFIYQMDLTNYQEKCLEFERLWCENNIKFLLEQYQIGTAEYFLDIQYYYQVHNCLERIYTNQIHQQMQDTTEKKIVVLTEEEIPLWTMQPQYFDTCIICNAGNVTDNNDIGNLLANCGKLVIIYNNTKNDSHDTVKKHSEEHNFRLIRYGDYIPVLK